MGRELRIVGDAPRNNIGRLLHQARCTEAEAAWIIWGSDAQSILNRYKNRLVVPTIVTAWRIVRGLREVTGNPGLTFEQVFPPPPRVRRIQSLEERRAA